LGKYIFLSIHVKCKVGIMSLLPGKILEKEMPREEGWAIFGA